MKKYYKVIIAILFVALVGAASFRTSYKAEQNKNNNIKVTADSGDGSEVGTANLNNTADNSAQIGSKLIHPEKGWKRYDDTNSKIQYNGMNVYTAADSSGWYNGTEHMVKSATVASAGFKFMFYGKKIRLIAATWDNVNKNCEVYIDNKLVGKYDNSIKNDQCVLVYEKQVSDSSSFHTMEIKSSTKELVENQQSIYFDIDAIDIDETGYLVDSISSRALLEITMSDGDRKEYDLGMDEVNKFVDWYNNKTSESYKISKDYNVGPFDGRDEYIAHDKVSSFEVKKYTKGN